MGSYAFSGCKSLKSINIPKSVTSIDRYSFKGCENLTIYVPAGSYAEKFAKEKNIPFVAE
ncbi:MAG: leucine-rich repeat protein [Clostridia bacterium]|nr:leucine-rich repeat protein [Clostridia bacterium]